MKRLGGFSLPSLTNELNLDRAMKNFEFREIGNNDLFDPTTVYENAPFTQAAFYGDWQKNLGRTVKRFLVNDGGKPIACFQLIKYPLLLDKSYFSIPYGPVTLDFSENFLASLKKELIGVAKKERAVFIRLDFTEINALAGRDFLKHSPGNVCLLLRPLNHLAQ